MAAAVVSKALFIKASITNKTHLPSSFTPMLSRSHQNNNLEELKETTRVALMKRNRVDDPMAVMDLIDDIQRLGLAHHFKEEINLQLCCVSTTETQSLFVDATRFRLLRHNGFPTSSETFVKFLSKDGKWNESITKDIRGMLSLYEASNLATPDEEILLQAMDFTTTHLIQSIPFMPSHSRKRVLQAIELPRHLRMPSWEARNYIDDYAKKWNHNHSLLQLAKKDFNSVQELYNNELAEIQRWWGELGLVSKLGFGRDRPIEYFMWTVGICPEPCYSTCRIELSKSIAMVFIVDDIFDTYGSLDDLILFTNAIQRWDLDAIEHIPEYMKICYKALYEITNDISIRILKDYGWNVLPHLKRTWIDIFDAQLKEAKWFNRGYVPNLDEYVDNAVTSGGAYMALVHAFFLMGQGVTRDNIASMEPYPELFSSTGKIFRLWDDIGTAREEAERGDVACSIGCYMRENCITSEEEATMHIRKMIRKLWIDLNTQLTDESKLPMSIVNASLNLARTSQVLYETADDQFRVAYNVKEHALTLFSDPIPLVSEAHHGMRFDYQ